MKALGLITVLAALLARCCVQAQAVFAHFMVGNTANFTVADWETNMVLAIEAHIVCCLCFCLTRLSLCGSAGN
jgi:hypothetical protein